MAAVALDQVFAVFPLPTLLHYEEVRRLLAGGSQQLGDSRGVQAEATY